MEIYIKDNIKTQTNTFKIKDVKFELPITHNVLCVRTPKELGGKISTPLRQAEISMLAILNREIANEQSIKIAVLELNEREWQELIIYDPMPVYERKKDHPYTDHVYIELDKFEQNEKGDYLVIETLNQFFKGDLVL